MPRPVGSRDSYKRAPKSPIPRTCQKCGAGYVGWVASKYCAPCAQKAKHETIVKKRVQRRATKPCGHCGKPFECTGRKGFCSLDCQLRGTIREDGGCWLWQGPAVFGYGQIRLPPLFKNKRVHRVAYEHWIGPIPKGMCVCHKCDVRNCINPEHLFLGTTQENTADKVAKGRQNHSENHGKTRLSREAVAEILATPPTPGSGAALARKYGVTPTAILLVRKRKNWKHFDQ